MAIVSLRPTSKGITVLIILAVVIFFGCVLAYMGAAGKLKAVAADLDKKEQQMAKSEKIAARLQESELKYLDTRAQIRNLESSVSTQAYVPTLLKQLEHHGELVNLRVLGVRPQPAAKATSTRTLQSAKQASRGDVEKASEQRAGLSTSKEEKKEMPYDELKIELELEGKFANALDFLYGLTTFPKIIAVDSIDVSPARLEPGSASPNLGLRMKVTAFVLKDDKPTEQPKELGPSASVINTTGRGTTANEAG